MEIPSQRVALFLRLKKKGNLTSLQHKLNTNTKTNHISKYPKTHPKHAFTPTAKNNNNNMIATNSIKWNHKKQKKKENGQSRKRKGKEDSDEDDAISLGNLDSDSDRDYDDTYSDLDDFVVRDSNEDDFKKPEYN